jgi:rfaE bifunctional protein kinase chain/domain
MTHAGILRKLPGLKALVVGDLCLDRWCTYDPRLAEPSRETGIPRTAVISVETTAGAAGTVANNLADLGVGEVAVMSAIGADGFGFEVKQALGRRRISTRWLKESPHYLTFTYTKLINASTGEEDLPRVDFVPNGPAPAAAEAAMLHELPLAAAEADVVYVADQAETENGGIISPAVREVLDWLAREHPQKVFFADSRVRIDQFRHLILKPNEDEAARVCQERFGDPRAYARLRAHTRAPLIFVTHGGSGVTWVDDVQEHFLVTPKVARPVDICGAGDSFSAGCGTALAAGATPAEAADFGHAVASVTVMKKGTGTATPAEILAQKSKARKRRA